MTSAPPTRPSDWSELGFRPRGPVHWFSPSVLGRAGAKVVLSAVFGDYLDKRELQRALEAPIFEEHRDADEVWVDVIADTGDGFDPVYSVAWCAAQPTLTPAGADRPLPRGEYLVLAGDEVYPVASREEYEHRFVGPHRAALPWTAEPNPRLLAIPGNHDWYDGLTSFTRVFAQRRWIGGRLTAQRRSYFAVALPHGHWLWGIDIQNDAYLDAAQIEYFETAAAKIAPGERLILCTAKPSWADDETPDAYANLRFVERKLVPPHAATVLMISGDKHHYARYSSADGRAKVTAGGGGAFLSATNHLPDPVAVPVAGESDETEQFRLDTTYPAKSVSRKLGRRTLLLGAYSPSFMIIPAVFNLLLFVANVSGLRSVGGEFGNTARAWSWADLVTGRFRSPFTIILALMLVGLLAAFYDLPKNVEGWRKPVERAAVGLAHAAGIMALSGTIGYVAVNLLDGLGPTPWFRFATAAFVFVVGGVVGSVAFGLYLLIAFWFGRHDNEVFSSFRVGGYNNFLRLRVAADGITVYPIGIDDVCHDWALDPDNPSADAPHIRPAEGPIVTHLIEPPFSLPRGARG